MLFVNQGCNLDDCNPITNENYMSMIVSQEYHRFRQDQAFAKAMEILYSANSDNASRIYATCNPTANDNPNNSVDDVVADGSVEKVGKIKSLLQKIKFKHRSPR